MSGTVSLEKCNIVLRSWHVSSSAWFLNICYLVLLSLKQPQFPTQSSNYFLVYVKLASLIVLVLLSVMIEAATLTWKLPQTMTQFGLGVVPCYNVGQKNKLSMQIHLWRWEGRKDCYRFIVQMPVDCFLVTVTLSCHSCYYGCNIVL